MGKIGEEITQKIKSAVKAKLIELGVEVDNELPDYIMVLVANKKTQSQMEKDLQLFLGSNTVLFTTWLLNVLKKLEEVTVSKKNYKRIEVTNQEDGLVVTKKEEDMERKQALKKLERIKVEPGTVNPEVVDEHSNISIVRDADVEEEVAEDSEERENDSSEDDSNIGRVSLVEGSPNQSMEQEAVADIEDASQDSQQTSSKELRTELEQDEESSHEEHPSETQDVDGITLGVDGSRPKVICGIREQIDKVMEKTINGNRRPREDCDASSDQEQNDDIRDGSKDDSNKFQDGRRKSLENDFYQDRKRSSRERERSKSQERWKSPDDYSRRRSPDNRRRVYHDYRRSPELRRRSPAYRHRDSDLSRRSPDTRRRSPFNRRKSPEDRRRSPFDRRKSPFDRRKSLDDRRSYDDRSRREDNRRSPNDRGRPRMLDAREILKRRTNKNDNVSSDLSSNDDSHRSEKRRKVVSSLVHKPEETKDKSSEPQIPSLVRVTPRPIRKNAIQPNKKLLLLAVADAEKSVSRPQKRHSPPTTSHTLTRKRELTKESHAPSCGYVPPEKIFVTLTNNQKHSKDSDGKHTVSREVSARKLYETTEQSIEDEIFYEDSYFDYEQDDVEDDEAYNSEHVDEYVPQPVKGTCTQNSKKQVAIEGKCIISLESSPERSCDEWEDVNKTSSLNNNDDKLVADKPLTPPYDCDDAEKTDDGFEWSRLGPAPVATVKPLAQGVEVNEKYKGEAVNKALERCKFWPSCLSGNCIYFHPSVACKMFPQCKSGKECLFIHPDCKFGPTCLNPKCNFLHRSNDEKNKVMEISGGGIPPVAKPSSPPLVKCAYFPNCKNLNCKFWHPVKKCKFGHTCARSDCYFFHPTLVIPPKELLTWTAKT